MALTTTTKRYREFTLELTGQTSKMRFQVQDDSTDFAGTELAVYQQVIADVPEAAIGAAHPILSGHTCAKVGISRSDDAPSVWDIVCDYKTAETQEEDQQDEDPLDRDPEIEWSFAQFDEAVEKDRDGLPLLNILGRPFEGVTRDAARAVVTITRFEENFSAATALQYANVVNMDDFIGAEPGQALMKPIRARRIIETRTDEAGEPVKRYYWQITYEIHFKLDEAGWKADLLEADVYERLDVDGSLQLVRIKDAEDNEITEPLALRSTTNGQIEAMRDRATAIANATYKQFDIYREAAFGPLNLESVLL